MNMVRQNGQFVCSVAATTPIEDLLRNKDDKPHLSCLNIHKSLRQYIIDHYLGGSIEEYGRKLFVSNKDVAQDVYTRTLGEIGTL